MLLFEQECTAAIIHLADIQKLVRYLAVYWLSQKQKYNKCNDHQNLLTKFSRQTTCAEGKKTEEQYTEISINTMKKWRAKALLYICNKQKIQWIWDWNNKKKKGGHTKASKKQGYLKADTFLRNNINNSVWY